MNCKTLPYFSMAIFILFLASCQPAIDKEKAKKELMEVDRSFSNLSLEKGMNKAFLEYLADDGVLLRPNRMPIVGREKITETFSNPDTTFSLTWEPLFADVAESGELGYTYGTYKIDMYSPDGNPVTTEGTYLSVWKKDQNGHWKFVMDTGNQGLGKKTE